MSNTATAMKATDTCDRCGGWGHYINGDGEERYCHKCRGGRSVSPSAIDADAAAWMGLVTR